jgi:hypothetical protein
MIVKMKDEPLPGVLSTRMSPPISSQRRCADREAEAGAAVFARGGGVDLAEGLEQPVDPVRGDADAGVADRELEQHAIRRGRRRIAGIGERAPAHLDRDAAARGELDGVVDEVDEHLAQAGDVADDPRRHAGAMW